ncbi:unnamed protein product [Moneuplotes crassus]|uniref:Secreted protein n=1 Tax=Euplotes crassus TaxID=5936 RepID=A0AAD1X864_EUPCR|nr:unnamed protein product [Moneuplotes crassus]
MITIVFQNLIIIALTPLISLIQEISQNVVSAESRYPRFRRTLECSLPELSGNNLKILCRWDTPHCLKTSLLQVVEGIMHRRCRYLCGKGATGSEYSLKRIDNKKETINSEFVNYNLLRSRLKTCELR